MRLGKLTVLSCITTLALSCLLAGQNPPTPSAPTLKVYSRETIVDVTVTDSKGDPVHGLTRDDFTIKEDNKLEPIRSFNEYGSEIVSAPPKLPPNVYTNLQPPARSASTNILWLDFTNAAPTYGVGCCASQLSVGPSELAHAIGLQRRAKEYVEKNLHDMPVGTRAAILGTWYPPGRLRILQGVTSDPTLLSAAVGTMPLDTDSNAVNGETWCAQQEQRNRMTLESLNEIAADLAQIKGRKNLLWFTTDIRYLVIPQWNPPCLTDLLNDVQKAYGLLAAAQVTVYPISVRGVEENGKDKAEDNLSLETVAEATGGQALYNSNDLADLTAKAMKAGSDYYTLSYIPPGGKYDGKHHTVQFDVDKPGLHLVYRDEYWAEDPAAIKPTPGLTLATVLPETIGANPHANPEAAMRLAMDRAMPTRTDILFDVQVGPSTIPAKPDDPPILGTLDSAIKANPKGKPLTRYGFQYAIPARQLTFTPGPNGTHKGALELDIAVYDGDLYGGGKLVTGLSQTVSMPLSDARYQEFVKGPFHFTQQLDLPPGQLFLRIGVFDPTSNKVGTLEIPLTVPKK